MFQLNKTIIYSDNLFVNVYKTYKITKYFLGCLKIYGGYGNVNCWPCSVTNAEFDVHNISDLYSLFTMSPEPF